MRLIAFHGPAGSGKSTCATLLVEKYGFQRVSFAGPLYDMLEAGGFGRPKTQAEKEAIIPHLGFSWRHAAQTLGTEWGRKCLHPDIWTNLALAKCRDPDGSYVIEDLRFENEAALVRAGGGHVVHLLGRRDPNISNSGHASEQGIVMQSEDWQVDNSFRVTPAMLHELLHDLLYQLEVQ